ncbi:hypothetical protein ACFSKN_09210 [Mariniflexile gromovii]|uniref:Uncharacterized protein n=1 Tax=Mariniflexile gromovii TaxID=362523 RepID=A0ABS4BTX3_9FLAO|nr:hypothetical protein [Mariniflexile gromovii]MBP0904035.1 hypothetical protein [Mariniflexile gromovii]
MDLTNRQTNIINIVTTLEKASLSTIRALLEEPISIPTLNREIEKLIYHKILYQIGRGRTKAYALSPN